jgi:flagellar assembly protein FliH
MSNGLHTARDLGRSHGMSIRPRPHDPGVPIDYVVLSKEAEASAADAGREAGYQAGYAAGQDAARAEAVEAARLARARLEQALGALGHASHDAALAFAERRDQLEHSVSAFAFDLVETLLGRELALSADPGRDAVARALAVDSSALPATVRIHPDDADTFRRVDDDALAGSRELTVVADASVEPGGAVVEIGEATIDSQLSAAVQRVRDILITHPGGTDTEDHEKAS